MKSIEIIMLPVKDRQKAKEFYLQLGFQVITEANDPHGEAWIQVGMPGGETTFSLSSFPAVICETADIEKEVKELKEAFQNRGIKKKKEAELQKDEYFDWDN